MYYKIIRWVVDIWGIKDYQWEIYPDQNSALNWAGLNNYLINTKFRTSDKPGLICLFEDPNVKNPPKFPISTIKQQQSDKEPLIQLADFFAGISRFSKDYGNEYFKWLKNKEDQKELTFFKEYHREDLREDILSKKRKVKFGILENLDDLCKKNKLQVSLRQNKCLITMRKSNPLNFWFYQPQSEEDKAPTKS